MRAIVGLGNPGPEYEWTRHNAGFLLADAVAAAWEFPPFKRPWRWRARVSQGRLGDEEVVIVKPGTYMNRSGAALGPLLRTTFAPERDLLVLVDEVALGLGTFRLRAKGSDGGHNGLKSIAGRLASQDYARLRIGVGPQPADYHRSDYVLEAFEADELDALRDLLPEMVQAVECWAREGIETAMNRFNRRGTQGE